MFLVYYNDPAVSTMSIKQNKSPYPRQLIEKQMPNSPAL